MRAESQGSDDEGAGFVQATTLRQQVADALRQAILCGELKPGQRLREIDLARRFGVSRNPVREAIGELEQQGLIVTTPNQAKMVVDPSAEDMRQAAQVRICLEMLALRLAWPSLSDGTVAQWRRIVEGMSQVRANLAEPGVARLGRLNCMDAEFHGLLVQCAGNSTLMRAWTAASPWVLAFMRNLHRPGSKPADFSVDPHVPFVDAVEQCDYAAAELALFRHLQASVVEPERVRDVLQGKHDAAAFDLLAIVSWATYT